MSNVESILPYLQPLRKEVVVRRTPAEAFEVFTSKLHTWWPLHMFSIHQADAATCGIEPRVGGEVFERSKEGARAIWGTVLLWDPPRRFAMTWHPGREADTAQEVEVRFTAVPDGTKVELIHSGWAKLGAQAKEAREGYEGGWATVFESCFVEACS
ncbi:MAG TPA: SRPBCC family protein [Candidatus Polarisedimenticolaceae bacterium]|nr:SRPBCC family protein [Candidatus Polarisedimenticolaceae bacterium]